MNSKTNSMMAVDCRISIAGKQSDQVSEECTICYEKITDKAFVNNCLHYFCFTCINQWIEVRAVCPLCVQPIDSIISNVRSADDYDLQAVEPPETDVLSSYLDADVQLWPARDDYDDDDDDDDEVFYLSHLSSDDSAPVSSSTDSESSPTNDFHDAMDEDSSDISHGDGELTFNCDTDVLSSDDEVKSHISSYSEMGDEDWQEDSTWFENETENEIENHSVFDSDVENEEPFDFTYDNLCESDDNNSPASLNLSESEESAGSGYEYYTDEDDYDDQDFSFNDSFDNY